MASVSTSQIDLRRHDLDALRAFAMLLGIALHASISFFPVTWPVQDRNQNDLFGVMFLIIHGFRMPLFFVMSGFFTAMLWRKRGLSALFKHRFRRIGIPLLLSMVTILPLTSWSIRWAVHRSETLNRTYSTEQAAAASLWQLARDRKTDIISHRQWTDAELNAPDPRLGSTPLSIATIKGHADIVKLLLKSGADPSARNKDGGTALHYACLLGRPEIAMLLVDHGADANATAINGDTPIDVAATDFASAQFVAGLYQTSLDETKFHSGQEQIAAILDGEKTSTPRSFHVRHRTWSNWLDVAMDRPLFAHLWFLWHLCWLVCGFGIYAKVAELTGWRLPAWWILSPARYLWIIPLTMLPQRFMARKIPLFGPDTSVGLVPVPHVFIYYALFFAFGALYYEARDDSGKVGCRWWLTLPIALLFSFPIGAICVFAPAELSETMNPTQIRLLGDFSQVSFAWLMTFGLMGLSRRLINTESKTVRYISDSAYWLYLAHMPVIFVLQALIQDWPLPAIVKFLSMCIGVTAILLVTYDKLVRYTWFGTLLNGPRTRSAAATIELQPVSLEVESA